MCRYSYLGMFYISPCYDDLEIPGKFECNTYQYL